MRKNSDFSVNLPDLQHERLDVKALSWAIALGCFFVLVLSIATLTGKGEEGHFLVIASPWANSVQTLALVANTDAQIVSAGGLRNVITVASEQADFALVVKAAGAWAVWPAPTLLGCGGDTI